MRIDVLQDSSRRNEELQYVTTHFHDLQGLRLAPLWAALLLLAGVAASHPDLLRWQLAAIALTIVSFSFGWLVWVNRWYKQHYGDVKGSEPAVSSGIISILHPEPKPCPVADSSKVRNLYFLLVALYIVPELFRRFDKRFGEFGLIVVVVFVMPKLRGSASDNLLLRLRRIAAFTASIFVCAIYISYLLVQVDKWGYLAAVSALLLLLDLHDHWLFTRLLHGESVAVSLE